MSDLRWGFRVASRPEDGWGHMLRSLSLARAIGGKASFYVDKNPMWRGRIESLGFEYYVEPKWDAARMMREAISSGGLDSCVFDGYEFDQEVAATAKNHFVAQIVDFSGEYKASFVISPGLGAESLRFGERSFVAGAAYAMLRPEFSAAHVKALRRPTRSHVRSLLVAFGGHDSGNATGLVLDALMDLSPRPRITVILAADAPHRVAIEAQAGAIGAAVLLDVEDMASLYLDADLAIGAGGVSLLERLCCGLPSLIVTQSDNQIFNASAAEKLSVATVLGALDKLDRASVISGLRRICEDHELRQMMRTRGLELVDGRGSQRVAEILKTKAQMVQ